MRKKLFYGIDTSITITEILQNTVFYLHYTITIQYAVVNFTWMFFMILCPGGTAKNWNTEDLKSGERNKSYEEDVKA